MKITKLAVLVAHEDNVNLEDLMSKIEFAIGSHLEEEHVHVIFEVRDEGTREVTLGSIDWSIENREPLEVAKREFSTPVAQS